MHRILLLLVIMLIFLPQIVYAQQESIQFSSIWDILWKIIVTIIIIIIIIIYFCRWKKSCKVSVVAIKFNHNTSAHNTDALNIRRNYTQEVSVPEWTSGETDPKESPAAYSIQDTSGNTITIKVKLRISPKTITSAEVKATVGGILGQIDSKTVQFSNGISVPEFVEFELNHNTISSNGVKIENIKWQWMYRCKGHKTWKNMDITRHRIYLVIKEPILPWKQTPFPNNQNPWTQVLEYSCDWAQSQTTLDGATTAVTTKVNQPVGNVEYDIPGGGASHYSGYPITARFNCTAYLDRLNGGPGNGKYVNCTDCASIVATFSNILGCELWESKMGWSFELYEIIAIGLSTWAKPWGNGFSYHEVGWKDSAGLNDNVFDGCLKINGNPSGTRVAELPLNIPFDDSSSLDYREKLVPPASIGNCLPQTAQRTRREVY